jgi:hypothetical protein
VAVRHIAVVGHHTVAEVPLVVAAVVPSVVVAAAPLVVAEAVRHTAVAAAVPLVAVEVVRYLLLRFRSCCKSLPLQPDCRNLNKMPLAKTPSINVIFVFTGAPKPTHRIPKSDIISLNKNSQYVLQFLSPFYYFC